MNSSLAKERIHQLEKVKNIVVKVGSSTLTYNNGLLNLSHIEHFGSSIIRSTQ